MKFVFFSTIKFIVNIIIFSFIFWQSAALAKISVKIDPPTAELGEVFRLSLSTDEPKANGVPDLMPLKKDFTIVGTERRMSYNIVNGQSSSFSQWVVSLTAKKIGVLTIPPIKIGNQISAPTSIEITGDEALVTKDDDVDIMQDEVMLKTKITKGNLYVNQEILYTVKLYNSQRLLDTQFLPPSVEDALLIPLGDSNSYQVNKNGRDYFVEELQYAIFPQKSGELKINPPEFNALVFDISPRRIKIKAKQANINILPIPANYTGKKWLPAKKVVLTEIYDKSNEDMDLGGTLVRKVTMQAAGVPGQLLPTLSFSSTDKFNAYPEKPELNNSMQAKELIGRADVKITYIFNAVGLITIPALNIKWFNTETGKEEVSSLPARVINIKDVNGNHKQKNKTLFKPVIETPKEIVVKEPEMSRDEKFYKLAFWTLIGIILFLIIIFILWRFSNLKLARWQSMRALYKDLNKACKSNSPKEVQIILLRFAKFQWPEDEVISLEQLAKIVHDKDFKNELLILSEVLYGQGKKNNWQGMSLWLSFMAFKRKKIIIKAQKKELPPINPKVVV